MAENEKHLDMYAHDVKKHNYNATQLRDFRKEYGKNTDNDKVVIGPTLSKVFPGW
jgi:hypothetical protein